MKLTSLDKAQAINNDFGTVTATGGVMEPGPVNYRGSLAEIGAGQDVARYLFTAFGSSKTIVKTMSAYGKGCSNAIYGEVGSYISEARLMKMFEHDYGLLFTRSLADDEKPKNQRLRYFVFANTVDINRDGWAAVRVQETGCALADSSHDAVEYRVHFEILARDKAAKIEIVGKLGINLIHGAILLASEKTISEEAFIAGLMDNIEPTDLRIDSIKVKKFHVCVDRSSRDQARVSLEEVSKDWSGKLSTQMSIELVKTSMVRCAVFKNGDTAASPSYTSIGRTKGGRVKHVVLTYSACATEGLPLESEMLRTAKSRFQEDLAAHDVQVDAADIVNMIQMPILGVLPTDVDLSEVFVYMNREEEPPAHRQRRVGLIKNAPSDEIAARIERIIKADAAALLSEFSPSSEVIKFLRTRTRLKTIQGAPRGNEIAFVLRADQLVMWLINMEERFEDRDPLEIIGSIIRRRTVIYVYPCALSRILDAETLYGTAIKSAFKQAFLRKHHVHEAHRVKIDIEHLKTGLSDQYSSLMSYMESANCIHDLNPDTQEFINLSLRPDIG